MNKKTTPVICLFLLCLTSMYIRHWYYSRISKELKSSILTNEPLSRVEVTRLKLASDLTVIQFVDSMHGWVGSDKGELYRTVNGGKAWQKVIIDSAPQYITGISFTNESQGWVSLITRGSDVLRPETIESKILYSTDGGQNWNTQYVAKEVAISRVKFLGEQEGWAVGSRSVIKDTVQHESFILHTTDKGRNWVDVSNGANRVLAKFDGSVQDSITDVCVAQLNKAIVLTAEGQVMSTYDGGQTWKQTDEIRGEAPQMFLARLGYVNEKLRVLGGTDGREGIEGVLAYKNQAGEWIKHRAGIRFNDIIFLSDTKAIVAGAMPHSDSGKERWDKKRDGVLLSTIDSGLNWAVLFRDEQIGSINALSCLNEKYIWGCGNNGFILKLQLEN